MDYSALRAQTLGSGTDEEAVTVNTRALIDKVLARYSGEWTVLRELLQNAADAAATRVTIKFETIPSSTVPLPQDATLSNLLRHTVQNHTIKRMVVTNNGQPFNENDWSRLKRIAEGNPDETKIGAFGVGFYSTFADCEEPFVSSGREAMAFFWKNNSLFTRRLKLSEAKASNDTTFLLDYRDVTSPVPPLLPLAQFLASSLTFVGLEQLDLHLDQWHLLALKKKASPSYEISIPRDIEPKTSEGFMKVIKVTKEVAQIDGEWMTVIGWSPSKTATARSSDREAAPSLRKFFSRLAGTGSEEHDRPEGESDNQDQGDKLATKVSATVFLHVSTASIKAFTGQKFNEELERATKKPPPKITKLAILTTPYVEMDTVSQTQNAGDVFGTVLPTRSGKIFIGFPTHQTTGLSAHISAPSVIPTVERESIDLNARYVRTWNTELLRTAGIVCRIAWHEEMTGLTQKIIKNAGSRTKIHLGDVSPCLPEAITTFNNYTFRESTPSARIGDILEDAFWKAGKSGSIDVLSSCGVLPTHEVRMAPKDLSFMDGIPILPDRLVSESKPFVDKLVDFGLVTEVTVSDIKKALESSALNSTHVAEFLSWITKQATKAQLDPGTIQNLLSVGVANIVGADGTSDLLLLGQIQHFLVPSRMPVDLPVPPTVMPFKYTRALSKQELESLGWQELQIVPWVRWLIESCEDRAVLPENQDITSSMSFSGLVLPVLSKQWDSLSQSSKASLVELLSKYTVIPTKLGMRRPSEAYFPNVKLFDDLPIITGIPAVKDKFLSALGVRKTVELGVVFDRLLKSDLRDVTAVGNNKPGWSHMDLIHYLASVRDDIPRQDIQRLQNTPIVPRFVKGQAESDHSRRYRVSELFEPRPDIRELGLPVLSWQGPYRSGTPEGRLLSLLGLRTVPSVEELCTIMAEAAEKGDFDLRDRALAYFLSRHHAHGYGSFDFLSMKIRFLPLENKPGRLCSPADCFVDSGAAQFGFNVLKHDWAAHAPRFGVRANPPIDACVNFLAKKPPTTHEEARQLFAYFASRLSEINASSIAKLKELNFVPVFSEAQEKSHLATAHLSPRNCFLGESDSYGKIFHYVDFGNEANSFLVRCGSKLEPTKIEIAQILVREPARISSTFKNPEKYLMLLRSMADSVTDLKKNKELFREMKRAPFLLASKELPSTQSKSVRSADDYEDLEEDDAQGIREFRLCSAEEAIIVDDYLNYSLFKSNILAAPQEEILEDFYMTLGSPLLSSLVEEAAKHGPRAPDQTPARKLQKQIFERSRLFLHDQLPDAIKHDTKWLEKNLTVQLVSSITLRRWLKGRDLSHTEKRTAVVTQVNREFTLWIAGERPDLYQVSQALVHLLLNRPKPHSALTLETLLKHDLLDLRARGFNVNRILRQKAAEARLAESKRQQELEREQKRIEEQQKTWAESQEQASKAQSQMAGAFPESPDNGPVDPQVGMSSPKDSRSSRNLLSNISRQLGFNNHRQLQSLLGNRLSEQLPLRNHHLDGETPPPYSLNDSQSNGLQKTTRPTITAPHQLQENLLSAIRKTRPHNSSDIYSRGETNQVSETKSYCDERPAHDLTFVAEVRHGIQMFLSPSSTPDSTAFLQQHAAGLSSFADLLKAVGDVFSLNSRSLNIFFETGGKTIAFNRNGAIFCNYLYFEQLHEKLLMEGKEGAYADALVYWWVILCHELAHNLVGDHSSDHSYYTEGFVSQYFGKAMGKIVQAQGQTQERQPQGRAINLLEA